MTAQQIAQGIPQQRVSGMANPAIAQHGQYGIGSQQLMGIPDPAIPQGGPNPAMMAAMAALPDPSVPQSNVTVQSLRNQAQGIQQNKQQNNEEKKVNIRWHPNRNSKIAIELGDSILSGLPDSIEHEPDPQAKVVAALFAEILSLRERIQRLEEGGSAGLAERIYRLEMTLFEQTQALNQGARAFREEVQRQEELLRKEEENKSEE
jgi:hypothetical protein